MPESKKHRTTKMAEAGATGKTETPLPGGQILDASTRDKAVEVQITVTQQELLKAAKRLRASRKRRKVLVVPKAEHVPAAAKAMRRARVTGTARTPRRRGRPPLKITKVRT